ncbi:hemerythrin [Clostridium acidisoli DSM 12555]|jgi:hemerythrin|uniref:Hemerythrin n=1 Tax=Clostridium acidisoli DSM 12555 TaxID=1121291 RepID=A0A1W1XAV6_9CLOT|nr:hemerythrin family protein [Clostridium acidisoli]SMC21052.1 hemerythrin [Clostridium acidisoli DSM 12555]
MFEMKDEFRTGIKIIDEEHEKLFEIAERVYQLLKNPFTTDKYDKIVLILEELKNYTEFHFKDEEEYMASINYTGLFTQKVQHAEFIKVFDNMDLKSIDSNQDESLMKVLDYISKWLVEHILKEDLKINEGI